jgi:hypothetical protein
LQTGFCYVAQTWWFSCLSLMSAEITGMYHHAWLCTIISNIICLNR